MLIFYDDDDYDTCNGTRVRLQGLGRLRPQPRSAPSTPMPTCLLMEAGLPPPPPHTHKILLDRAS